MAGVGQRQEEKYAEKLRAAVTPQVDGPVDAVGMFSRPGSMASVLVGPLAAGQGILGGKSKKRAGGLPQNTIIAATPTSVYAFEFKPGAFGKVKAKGPVAHWPRSGVRVVRGANGTLGSTIRFEIVGLDPIELDSNSFPGVKSNFNEALLQALSGPTSIATPFPSA